MKILVVDDDIPSQRILGKYLKKHGYDTIFATNGVDAIEILAKDSITMIITGLNMPIMGGIEFIEHVKSNPLLNTIPILVITTDDRL
ncbi:MAG: response regulator [Nitrospirae bacterium YQR-1]